MLFLVVDDDELSRELLAMLLESEGHEVKVAVSGEEGLARLSGEGSGVLFVPDVILADMQMAGVSGSDLASLLRAAGNRKSRLFAMSGSQPSPVEVEGYDGFLLKPFTMDELSAALDESPPGQGTVSVAASAEAIEPNEARLPVLNQTVYGQLAKSMTAAQLDEMYALCVSDARKRIKRMAALAEAGDDKAYRTEAHTVKGGCGLIGATELYRLAETAETHGLELDAKYPVTAGINRIKVLLDRLSAACDRLERILNEQR